MRVIAGALGGRRLLAPPGLATRPTTDRVREALFSILGSMDGARLLDLYAGTGALGIEALSRGAAFAVFVEKARPALATLRDNLQALDLHSRSAVLARDVARCFDEATLHGPFDLVLADPPYADAAAAVAAIAGFALRSPSPLSADALIVVEHASRDDLAAVAGLAAVETRRYGDTAVTFLRAA